MTPDFHNICRLCMLHNEIMIPIFSNDRQLQRKIMSLSSKLKMSIDDGLPAQICQVCVHQVDLSYNFVLQCENSETTLRQYVLGRQELQLEHTVHGSTADSGNRNWDTIIMKEEKMLPSEFCDPVPQSNTNWAAVSSEPEICSGQMLQDKILPIEVSDGAKDDIYEHASSEIYQKCTREDSFEDECCDTNVKSDIRKQYTCQDCGKDFPQKSNLIAHTRIHTGERPFSCSKCDKSFGRRSTLQDHIRTHTGERPFLCEECGKHFARSSHLKVHLKVHSGERPHTCPHCAKTFVHGCHLKDHLVMHVGDRPFCCTECGKTFASSSVFKRHLSRHSGDRPFACTECGKRFGGSSDLYIHARTHTGDKRYACSECGRRFLLGCHLKDHLKTHTGERPFICMECGKKFARKHVLNKHLKSHCFVKKVL